MSTEALDVLPGRIDSFSGAGFDLLPRPRALSTQSPVPAWALRMRRAASTKWQHWGRSYLRLSFLEPLYMC